MGRHKLKVLKRGTHTHTHASNGILFFETLETCLPSMERGKKKRKREMDRVHGMGEMEQAQKKRGRVKNQKTNTGYITRNWLQSVGFGNECVPPQMELFCFADTDFFLMKGLPKIQRCCFCVSKDGEDTLQQARKQPTSYSCPFLLHYGAQGMAFCLKLLFPSYESLFFPLKAHKNTLKPLNSIQILMILCNSFAATK